MKILVTGGCGFLGSNLAAHALDRGYALTVFDNLSRMGAIENLQWLQKKGKFQFIHGDIRNPNDIGCIVKGICPTAIFHLAGQVAMTTSIANPRLDFETNALGSFNLLEAVRLHAPETTIVYSSTNKVYGDLEQFSYGETDTRYECLDRPKGFCELTPLDFHSPYGTSKGAADQYMLDYARIFGLKTVVFRHSSMYGGRQHATYDQGWVGWFCQKACEAANGLQKEPFTISGTGKQVRDVLHSDDMIRLYFAAIDNIECAAGEVFNVGGGMDNSLSLLELFNLLEKLTEVRMEFTKLPARISDQRVFVSDCSKAAKLLGWHPQVDKVSGLKQMLEWVRNGK